ncbi:MAG: hypothetical protein ABIJ84_00280, partial [bacterium]
MRIIIKTKNIEATESLRSFTEKKFYGLKKFIEILKREDDLPPTNFGTGMGKTKFGIGQAPKLVGGKGKTLAEVLVELERETKHHKKGDIFIVKCRILLPGRSLMSKAKSDDILKAIIAAKDEIKTEIEKYKFKKIAKRRR